jgi:thiamine transport system substrate-binding protein
MKKIVCALIAVAAFLPAVKAADPELTVYTYESLDWIKTKAVPAFEKANGCKVKIVKFTDAGNIVARLKLESANPAADCAVGLTPSLVYNAKKNGLIEKISTKSFGRIEDKKIIFDAEYALPFDYGALAIVYNPAKMKKAPSSFADVLAVKKGLIIQDPRTSSTGQDFLLWTVTLYGKDWKDFWKKLNASILTVTPGWDASFAKFEAGEAPMMLSYATDGAYSWHNYKSIKYKAFIPKEGGYVQIESSCVVKGTKKAALALKFAEFMLSDDVQKEIPLNQWMFPAAKTKLPEAFIYAEKPKKVLVPSREIIADMEKYLSEWQDLSR